MEAVTKTNMKWNAGLYDGKHDFVFKYGEDVVDLLNPQPHERILDLGCGTGYLTNLIAESGSEVVGIDSSAEMIEKAKKEYPAIDFKVLSATDFCFDAPFDAIFSNAVLHWVLEKEAAVKCMYNNLKTNGRLVVELGGKNNIERIIKALKASLVKSGYGENAGMNIWYFPSLSEYATLLEQNGFEVTYASYYNRPTKLKDTNNGIKDWVKMFASSFLKGIAAAEIDNILNEVQSALKDTNYKNGEWYADYKRLRIAACKL